MTAYIPIIVLSLYVAAAVLLIFIGRLITRSDRYRRWAATSGKNYPRSRIIEDFRPVQETMIEFIDASPPSHELLQRLAEADEPIRIRKLLASVSADERSWTALLLIAVAGLVSFGRNGVLLTDLGHEILARIGGRAIEADRKTPKLMGWRPTARETNLLSADCKNGSNGTSSPHLVPIGRNEPVRVSGSIRLIPSVELDGLRAQPAALSASNVELPTLV